MALIVAGCAPPVREPDASYTVQPGDTVYSIAWRHDVDFHDLARWNHLGSDYRISVGERLQLRPPAGAAVTPIAPAQRAGPRQAGPRPAGPGQAGPGDDAPRTSKPGTSTPAPPTVTRLPPQPPSPLILALQWGWPTDRPAVPIPVPSGGVLLPGRVGQDNRAAAAGRVVYNGDGIRGYGHLIIIKHSDAVLTAYAHNRESLVHEGQEVTLGQVIGHMGEGAPGKPVLYFEIRLNGRPVDPLPVLAAVKP